MSKNFKKRVVNGNYVIDDPGITAEQWHALLRLPEAEKYIDTLKLWLWEANQFAACSDVERDFGVSADVARNKITHFSKFACERFGITITDADNDTDREHTYWPMAMKKGWHEKGLFYWQLRDELTAALRRILMEELIAEFKSLDKPFVYSESMWRTITECQDKSHIDVANIIANTDKQSLIASPNVTTMKKVLLKEHAQEFAQILDDLADEDKDLVHRLNDFKSSISELCVGQTRRPNDARSASALLMCFDPQAHTLFMDQITYRPLCKYLGYTPQSQDKQYPHFLQILQPMVELVKNDAQLQQIVNNAGKGLVHSDLYIAQTIVWRIRYKLTTTAVTPTHTILATQPKHERLIALLEANRNVVLTGAPGTGKTHTAKEIAQEMGAEMAFVQFHPSYDYTDFVEGLRPVRSDSGEPAFERMDGTFKTFCRAAWQNLQDSGKSTDDLSQEMAIVSAMDNFVSDAIENATEFQTTGTGNKFTVIDNSNNNITVRIPDNNVVRQINISKKELTALLIASHNKTVTINKVGDIRGYFNRQFGTQQDSYTFVLYKEIRKKGTTLPQKQEQGVERKNFVFIIDEINRGDLSKIFGELFFAIDPGYRGEKGKVKTQYQNMIDDTQDPFYDGFFVPENVYIIGTMNDIDRSVESMDFAMRRRFAWYEVTAQESMDAILTPDNTHLSDEQLAELKATMTRLNDAIADIEDLGRMYQIGAAYFLKFNPEDAEPERALWENHLKGLLFEYLRGCDDAEGSLKKLENAYFNIDEGHDEIEA